MSGQDGHVNVKNPLICLLPILFCSLLLNTWGIDWGLSWNTDGWGWHDDEVTFLSSRMVDQRSLNPHLFTYGPLHYYEVMFFAVIPARLVSRGLKSICDDQASPSDPGHQEACTFASTRAWQWWWYSHGPLLLSRVLSGLFGTGTVLVVYLLAVKLFDRKAALISALLLAVSMAFVVYAHFATVDMSSTFWFTLSCLMSVYVWSSGGRRWSALSGLTAGLAAAVKYVGGVAIVPLMVAHVFSAKRPRSSLFLALLMVVVGFLLGSPVVLFSFSEFLDGASKELFFNATRTMDWPGFLPLAVLLKNALGLPVFVVSICGLLYSVKLLAAKGERVKGLLVWSMFLPYYALFESHRTNLLQYTLPILPFLSLLNGKMFADLLNSEIQGVRTASWVLLGAVASSSLVYTIGAELQFGRDSRYLVFEWIKGNVPSGSKIEVVCCGIPIPGNRYSIVVRPLNWAGSVWVRSTIDRRDESQGYVFIRKLASGAERVGRELGLSRDRKPYVAWYEFVLERDRQALALKEFDFSLKGLELRNPDYLVVGEIFLKRFWYERFFSKDSTEYQFYDALFRGRTAYKEITQIRFQFLPWFEAEIPWVNPRIFVFKRE